MSDDLPRDGDADLRDRLDGLLSVLPPLPSLPSALVHRARRRRTAKIGALGGLAALAVLGVSLVGLPGGTADRVAPLPPGASSRPPPTPAPPGPSPTSQPSGLPSTEPSARTTAQPGQPSQPVPPPVVVLDGGGLALAQGSGTSRLPFGETDGPTLTRVIGDLLGAPENFPTDCAGLSRLAFPGLTVVVRNDRFVGWATATPDLGTADDVRVGRTLGQVRASRQITLTEGTLGVELSSGDLLGFADGTSDASLVTGLRAGTDCLAR